MIKVMNKKKATEITRKIEKKVIKVIIKLKKKQ